MRDGIGQVALEPRGHALGLLAGPWRVSRRPRSGSPASASQCRQRIRSMASVRARAALRRPVARRGMRSSSSRLRRRARARAAPRAHAGASVPSASSTHASRVVGEIDVEALVDHAACAAPGSSTGKATSMRRNRLRPIQSARRQLDVRLAGVLEVPDAVVLEEAAEDRAHADVLRQARHARAAARTRRARSGRSRTPACDAAYSARITRLVGQRIHLGDDARRLAFLRVARLAADRLDRCAAAS